MPYTEMDNSTLALLSLISERTRKERKLQFTSLAHLLNKKFLRECYLEPGRDRASGIDGISWKTYGEKLDENLANLVKRMKAKRYKPQPAKRVYIPKNEHEKRPLGLPSLEDKIVQKVISRILEAIYEQDFLDCSYGFRPYQVRIDFGNIEQLTCKHTFCRILQKEGRSNPALSVNWPTCYTYSRRKSMIFIQKSLEERGITWYTGIEYVAEYCSILH